MSFVKNHGAQLSVFDQYYSLTRREKKLLENSWAQHFGDQVFPLINQERFRVLYSEDPAGRPNNPVNVYIGLLFLKDMFALSDEEAFGEIMFDLRYQYALHTSSYDEQPVSINSLGNFRRRVYDYYEKTGIDLIQEEVEAHAAAFAKTLKISGNTRRMDSAMIAMSAKKLSRLELFYNCIERVIKTAKKSVEGVPAQFSRYIKEETKNDTIYRAKDIDLDSRLTLIYAEAIAVYEYYKNSVIKEHDDFLMLSRLLGEQTKPDGTLKANNEIKSDSLQNPTDPDATYREKAGKKHQGYTANFVEQFDEDCAIIANYDLKPNNHSDIEFAKDVIENGNSGDTLIVDGAYYSQEIEQMCEEAGVQIVPTALAGGIPEFDGTEKFKFENGEVNECPKGEKPDKAYTNSRGEKCAKFGKEKCESCPYAEKCPVIKQKKANLFKASATKLNRLKKAEQMQTEQYKKLADKRAGVEGIPSVLRRRYGIDNIPVRGLLRSKIWLGFKIAAINIKRVIKGLVLQTKIIVLNVADQIIFIIVCFDEHLKGCVVKS